MSSHALKRAVLRTSVALISIALGDLSPAIAANLFWDPGLSAIAPGSGGAGTWDLNSTVGWFNGTTDVVWSDSSANGTDIANFFGTAGAVAINSNLSAQGLVFGTTGYTLAGGTLNLGSAGIDASALTTAATTTISAPVNLAASQIWNVGGPATSIVTLTGGISSSLPVTLTKTGTGTLTLATTAGTWTGNAVVNAGTLNVNIGQAITSYTVNGGILTLGALQSAPLTGTINSGGRLNVQGGNGVATLAAGSGFTINPGATLNIANYSPNVPVFTFVGSGSTSATLVGAGSNNAASGGTAAVMLADIAGNGNIAMGMGNMNIVDANWLRSYGGTMTWTGNETIRFSAGTTSQNGQFASLNTSTFVVALNNKNAGGTLFLGALAGGTATTIGAYNVDAGSANTSTTYSGLFGGAVTKVGLGTWTIKPSAVNTAASNLNANGGALLADYGNLTTPTNLFLNTSTLSFTGGTLDLKGKSGATSAQTLGAVTINGNGGGRLVLDTSAGASTTVNLTLGAITATAAGGSLNISGLGAGTTSVTTTTGNDASGIIGGGRVTFTDSIGNTNWATTTSGAAPFVLSGYSAYTPLPTAAATDTTNDIATDNVTLSGSVTTNSLKATTTSSGQSLNLGGNTLAVTNGGLLFTGANDYSISNGTLSSNLATNPDLIVHHYGTGNLTISAIIADGTAGATALTKAGAGTLTLGSNNTYTGTTNLTGGVTSISADHQLGGGNGTVNVASSTMGSTAVTLTSNAPAGFGVGSVFLGSTVTAITGTSVTLAGTGANTTLTAQDASWANAPLLNLNGGTLSASTSISLQQSNSGGAAGTSTANRNIVLYGGGGIFDVPGNSNLAVSGVVSSVNTSNLGPLVKANTGTLTLAGTPAVNFNITTTATSTDVTVDNSAGLVIGQTITGTGIPANATITAINSATDITISAAATTAGTNPASAYTANTYGAATIIRGGTLSTAILVNGGINSGVGSSPSVAPALVLDGGFLRYTGAGGIAGTTDRTFTLTTNGGGLDATGNTGPVVFSNTAPIVADNALAGSGARTFILTGNTSGNTFAGLIGDGTGGATSLNVTGTGSWKITNMHTYTGATSISGGSTLILAPTAASANPIASSSKISVGSGSQLDVTGLIGGKIALTNVQTLAGAGTITGSVSTASPAGINPGTHVAPGDVGVSSGVGTLTVSGSFTMATGSIYDYDFANSGGVPSGNDRIAVQGANGLTVNGGVFNLFSVGTANRYSTDATGLVLLTYTGADTLGGALNSILSVGNPVAGLSYLFHDTGSAITLDITGTPVTIGNWIIDGGGSWAAATNWDSNPSIPNGQGATANFGGAAATHLNLSRTISLDTDKTVGTLSFSNSNGEQYTLAAGSPAGNLILDNSGLAAIVSVAGTQTISTGVTLNSNATVTVSGSGDSLTIAGAIQGSKNITKAGAGTLALASANSYGPSAGTVGTSVSAGTLQVGNNASLSTGDLAITGNSTLQAGVAGLTLANNVVITTGATATVDTQVNTLTLSGIMSQTGASGTGALTKFGAGTLKLTGNSTYAGNTTISGGTLQLGDATATGSVAGNIVNNGALVLNHSDSGYTLNNTISGSGTLTQIGTAATLAGTNTFSGDTVLQAGTLTLGNSLALQNSTLNYNNQGGLLSFGTLTAATLGGLKGSEDLALANTAAAAVTLTVGNNNQGTTYSGILSGTGGALTKVGNGTLNLTNNSSLTGALTIGGGGLQLTTGQLNQLGAVTINSGFITVNGGSLISSAASFMNNNNAAQVTLNVSSGSVTFNGGLSALANASSNNYFINVTGGTFTASTLSMGRGGFAPTTQPTAGDAGSDLYVNGGVANITGALNMSTNGGTNSGVSARIDSGSLTVGGPITIGLNNGGRWSVLDVNGGTFASTDTVTGVQLGFTTAGNSELLVRGGTATVEKVTFGPTTADISQTGVVNVTSNKDTNGNITSAGTLYVGSGGMSRGFVGGTLFTPQVQLGDGATIGAKADFSSDANWILNGTTIGPTIQAADAANVPHNITIGGTVTVGTVASANGVWAKTGGGTLTLIPLNGTNSYNTLTINAGNLVANTDGLAGSIITTDASQTVTINQGNGTFFGGGSTSGSITGPGSLVKTGPGAATLNSANSYTGTTTVNQGALVIGAGDGISSTSKVTLAGGTLGTGGNNHTFATAPLQLTASSGLDMGAGASILHFADSHLTPWTAGSTLSVLNWSGNVGTGGGTDQLAFGVGGLTTGAGSQVSQIHFQGFNGATLLGSGEVVPTSVSTRVLGDWNVSGALDAGDLSAMLTALTDLNVWTSSHSLSTDDVLNIGDVNLSGIITNADIQAELDLLSAHGFGSMAAVPEPASFLLLGLGGVIFLARRRSQNRKMMAGDQC